MNMGSYSCCDSRTSEFNHINSLSSLLRLVGEKNRLQILCILRNGTHCVCKIMKHIQQSQSLISHHLKDLKEAGLIIDEKKGLNVYYSLTEKGKSIVNSIFALKEVCK